MTCFLDTSALVKIYHRESGTDRMLALYSGDDSLLVSELARLEFLTATMRKLREGSLSEDTCQVLVRRFEQDLQQRFELLPFSQPVVDETARVLDMQARKHPLRTLDAIQLGFYNVHCSRDTLFVCSDLGLITVAVAQGLPTRNPQAV